MTVVSSRRHLFAESSDTGLELREGRTNSSSGEAGGMFESRKRDDYRA